MINREASVLSYPWSDCEKVISNIGKRKQNEIFSKFSQKEQRNLFEFLKKIDFIRDGEKYPEFTDVGKEFYTNKFILKDLALSQITLSKALEDYLPTQAICQLLWGRPNINKESIYRLLILEEYIDSNEFREQELGAFLMLLNQCNILKYNKKANKVTIVYNPKSNDDFEKTQTKFLSPETPFSNVRNLKTVLRESTCFIHWFDKHFSSRGLEPLIDEADGTKINEIKILSGVTSGRINERLRSDFERFRDELKNRQIKAEFRVLSDKSTLNDIHDRWILSKEEVFNIPPVDTIFKGQFSEVKKTTNRPPFEDWWSRGLDLMSQWNEINKKLAEK